MKSNDVLVICGIAGAENFAAVLARQIEVRVEVVTTRRAGLLALRRSEFAVVVVEENLVESDPEWADQLWENAGMAIPMQINFSISGGARLGREVKSALLRRDAEYARALQVAATHVENELKGSLTGLLLQSELALREPAGSVALAPKLKLVVELAADIRDRFEKRQGGPPNP
jgi:hypothetical protein